MKVIYSKEFPNLSTITRIVANSQNRYHFSYSSDAFLRWFQTTLLYNYGVACTSKLLLCNLFVLCIITYQKNFMSDYRKIVNYNCFCANTIQILSGLWFSKFTNYAYINCNELNLLKIYAITVHKRELKFRFSCIASFCPMIPLLTSERTPHGLDRLAWRFVYCGQ
jgi:hypothetical protein